MFKVDHVGFRRNVARNHLDVMNGVGLSIAVRPAEKKVLRQVHQGSGGSPIAEHQVQRVETPGERQRPGKHVGHLRRRLYQQGSIEVMKGLVISVRQMNFHFSLITRYPSDRSLPLNSEEIRHRGYTVTGLSSSLMDRASSPVCPEPLSFVFRSVLHPIFSAYCHFAWMIRAILRVSMKGYPYATMSMSLK